MKPMIDYLNECFICDPVEGTLLWRERPEHHFPIRHIWRSWNTRFAGRRAGSMHKGRLFVSLGDGEGRRMAVHRIIWAMTKGSWPVAWIDHANGNPADNRMENLREATGEQNNYNRSVQRNSSTGFKGVFKRKDSKRYYACIRVAGTPIHLGYFLTPQEASAAYIEAAQKYHGEFANTSPTRTEI